MAGKIRFTLHNQSDLATVTATTEVATLPATNMQLVPRSKVWRSTSIASNTITCNLAAATDISAITVGRHNFAQSTSVVITAWDGASGTGTNLGSKTIIISAAEAYETASAIEYQDLKSVTWYSTDVNDNKVMLSNALSVTIVLSAGTGSFYEVGRLIVGDFIEPTYNLSYGHVLTYEEETKQYRTASGTLRSDMALPYKTFSFNIGVISETDRAILQEAFADVGKRKDFFLSVFSASTDEQKAIDYSAIMKLTKLPGFTEIQCNWYKSKYNMAEV